MPNLKRHPDSVISSLRVQPHSPVLLIPAHGMNELGVVSRTLGKKFWAGDFEGVSAIEPGQNVRLNTDNAKNKHGLQQCGESLLIFSVHMDSAPAQNTIQRRWHQWQEYIHLRVHTRTHTHTHTHTHASVHTNKDTQISAYDLARAQHKVSLAFTRSSMHCHTSIPLPEIMIPVHKRTAFP